MLISVVHQMCTYALYVGTTLRSSDHHSHLNGAERKAETLTMMKWSREARSWTKICTSGVCIAILPSACLARFSILKTTSASLARRNFERQAVWTVPTRCACKNTPRIHMLIASEFCLLAFFLLVWNHFLHAWSARQPPIRFERMATVLITDCVYTPGDCTRVIHIKLSAGCLGCDVIDVY